MTKAAIQGPPGRLPMINRSGPSCAWCGSRPDDPAIIHTSDQELMVCLGCVADARAFGEPVEVVRLIDRRVRLAA